MLLHNYYYYFKSALTPKFCDDLIRYGKSQQQQVALTGTYTNKKFISKKELKNLQKVRKSQVVWLNDEWIYKEIRPYIHRANKEAGWNYEWDYMQSCQFTTYKPGQFYDWHCDSDVRPYNKPNDVEHGKIRKLSVTCSLTDPDEYKGGELEFNFNKPTVSKNKNTQKCLEILPRGSIVVFPSFVWHRVCPVKKGTRNSLVIWNLGWPYK